MATPITLTWLQLQIYSGGTTCKEVQQWLDVTFPGTTDATTLDMLTYTEAARAAGHHHFLFPSIVRWMSATQRRDLIVWMLQQLKLELPVGWEKTAALSAKMDEIIDCLTTPTAGKRAALQAYSSGLVINYDDNKDRFITQEIKRLCNLVANQVSDHGDVVLVGKNLIRAYTEVSLKDVSVIRNGLLTKMQKIAGIID